MIVNFLKTTLKDKYNLNGNNKYDPINFESLVEE